MKYFYFLFVGTIVLTIAGCNSGDCIKGSGNHVSQMRDVEQFSSIEVHGSVKLVVKQGPQQLRIVADDKVLDEISTKVRKKQLIIKMEADFCEAGTITIYAVSPKLEGVYASGVVGIQSEGRINAGTFSLDLSGASKAMLDISCGEVHTNTSGASNVILTGQAGSHDLKMSGASELDAFDFVVGNYNINTSGSSALKINVLNDLNVISSGSSQILYRGSPRHISNNKSGASSITKVN